MLSVFSTWRVGVSSCGVDGGQPWVLFLSRCFLFYFTYMNTLPVYMHNACLVPVGSAESLELPELEFQMIVSQCMGAGN